MNKAVTTVGVIVVLLAALGGGAWFLMMNLDSVVKNLIEDVGTQATGTEVRVQDVSLNLTDGAGTISGLSIANPEGFSPADLFTMGSIKVDIDTASLTGTKYVIDEIMIDGANVLAEQVGGGTNLQALANNMKTAGDAATPAAEEAAPEVRLAVRNISFTNGSVDLKSDVFGERSLTLPDFNIRDLGTEGDGLTPEELGQEIASALVGEVTGAVSDELRGLARDAAKEKLKEKVGEGLNKLKGLFGGSGDEEEAGEGEG